MAPRDPSDPATLPTLLRVIRASKSSRIPDHGRRTVSLDSEGATNLSGIPSGQGFRQSESLRFRLTHEQARVSTSAGAYTHTGRRARQRSAGRDSCQCDHEINHPQADWRTPAHMSPLHATHPPARQCTAVVSGSWARSASVTSWYWRVTARRCRSSPPPRPVLLLGGFGAAARLGQGQQRPSCCGQSSKSPSFESVIRASHPAGGQSSEPAIRVCCPSQSDHSALPARDSTVSPSETM